MRLTILIMAMVMSTVAGAEPSSAPCKDDARIRCAEYDPDKVFEIVADVGYQTSVFFATNEQIDDKGLGYTDGWDVEVINGGNGFFIKPKTMRPNTNLTVVTNKRQYQFDLRMKEQPTAKAEKPKSEVAMYALKFSYGYEEAPENQEIRKQNEASEVERNLETAGRKKYKNMNYWVQGSEDVSPSAAYDDGTFTYLKFPPNMDLPSVFLIDPDGEESLANKHMENDQIVIEHVSRKLMLRRGSLVAALSNEAYDRHGIENESKTVSPGVKRNIKVPAQKKTEPTGQRKAITPKVRSTAEVRSTPAPIEERKVGLSK